MARKDQHAHLREFFRDAAENINAVQAGELGVQDADIRGFLQTEGHSALAIAGFADELVVGIESKDFHQHFADGGLVFDDNKALH